MIISLHHEDDLLAVIDRILGVPDHDIVLDIPDGARLLSSEENFVLLKRESESAGKHLWVHARDPRARVLATRVGLAMYTDKSESASSARRFSDILPPSGLTASPAPRVSAPSRRDASSSAPEAVPARTGLASKEVSQQEPPPRISESLIPEPIPLLESIPAHETVVSKPRLRAPVFPRLPRKWMLEGALGIFALVLLILVANEVLPNVEIRIHPRTEEAALTFPLTVAVDPAQGRGDIIGQRISVDVEETRRIETTATEEVTARAKGVVTITNAYSSSSQTLVVITRLVSQDGKLFRLDETVVVPGAKVEDGKITPALIDVAVTADEPGPEFNIGPSSFSIPGFQGTPKFTAFTGRSQEPMRGGARGKVKVVTADDVVKAQEGLSDQAQKKLSERFAEQLPENLIVLADASLESIALETDVEAGDHADAVVAKASGKKSAIAYREEDIRAFVTQQLAERIPDETEIIPESIVLEPGVTERDIEGGILDLSLKVSANAAWRIDAEAVRDAVAGKREGEIRAWLADQEAVESATVRFSPFWVSDAPENRKRIKIKIDLGGEKDQEMSFLDEAVAQLLH